MFDEIVKIMNKPALFTRGTDNFWNNEHISKSLLESSTDWISKRFMKVVDFGVKTSCLFGLCLPL